MVSADRTATFPVRIAAILEQSPVDRCLLVVLIVLPFVASFAVLAAYLLAHPEIAPYIDRSFLPLGEITVKGIRQPVQVYEVAA